MEPTADVDGLKRRLHAALWLNALVLAAEVGVGLHIRSIGLLSDAGHNTIDQGALFLTLYAHILSMRPASARWTFGYHRAGIVSAFLNAFLLLLMAAGLAGLAGWRLLHPEAVAGGWMAGAAVVSFFANLGIALLLRSHAEGDLNIRSAFWHMLGDAWVSFGVVASGLAILATKLYFLDPLISLVIVAVVVKGAWAIFRESMEILMEATPAGLPIDALAAELRGLPGVGGVHDMHAWTLKSGLPLLTCHLATSEADAAGRERVLRAVREHLLSRYGIEHSTIQISDAPPSDGMQCALGNLTRTSR